MLRENFKVCRFRSAPKAALCSRPWRSLAVHSALPSEENVKIEDLVQIGVIGGTHGVKGEVRVQPTSDFPEKRLGEPGTKWLLPRRSKGLLKKRVSPMKLESLGGRPHIFKGHSLWLVRFKDITNREQAAELNGLEMMIHSSERHELPDDEFYIQELIDARVINKANIQYVFFQISTGLQDNGEFVGVVDSIYLGNESPDILILKSKKTSDRPVMIPFVKEFVPDVDLDNKVLKITPPEDVIKKFIQAGAHIGYANSTAGSLRRDYLLNLERIARSRYETLYAISKCLRNNHPFCVLEEFKRDLVLSKRVSNIIKAYKSIKVRP